MKKLLFLILLIPFLSCSTKQQVFKYGKLYEFTKENPDPNTRPGYEGKVSTVTLERSPLTCKITLLDFNVDCSYQDVYLGKCKQYIEKHSYDVRKGDPVKDFIQGEYLDVEVTFKGESYYMSGQMFYPANRIRLDPYLEEAAYYFNQISKN